MHVDIQRADLSRILTAVSRVVEARNTYPILANVLITAEADKLTVRGTDLDIEISVTAAAVCTPGQTTVAARSLADIVRKLGGDTVVLELDDDHLVVKSGRSRFRLPTLSPDSFPEIKTGSYTHNFTVDFAALIAPVAFAISTEETRYYLNGIYLHPIGKGKAAALRAVATDGHRMARNEIDLPKGATGFAGIIVPAKTIKLLGAYAGDVAIEVGPERIKLMHGDTVVVSKLVEGTFPDYDRVTPKNNSVLATMQRKALVEALGRVSVIASDRGGRAVKLAFAAGALTLTVTNPDHGSATDELAVEFAAEPFEIGFNARYAQDVLANIKGDAVTFAFADAGDPALVSGGDRVLCVLMPMRV